jgi:hypothetical protein
VSSVCVCYMLLEGVRVGVAAAAAGGGDVI